MLGVSVGSMMPLPAVPTDSGEKGIADCSDAVAVSDPDTFGNSMKCSGALSRASRMFTRRNLSLVVSTTSP